MCKDKDVQNADLGAGDDFEETTSPDQGPGTIDLEKTFLKNCSMLIADRPLYLSPSKSPSEVDISGAFCHGPRGIDSLQ